MSVKKICMVLGVLIAVSVNVIGYAGTTTLPSLDSLVLDYNHGRAGYVIMSVSGVETSVVVSTADATDIDADGDTTEMVPLTYTLDDTWSYFQFIYGSSASKYEYITGYGKSGSIMEFKFPITDFKLTGKLKMMGGHIALLYKETASGRALHMRADTSASYSFKITRGIIYDGSAYYELTYK